MQTQAHILDEETEAPGPQRDQHETPASFMDGPSQREELISHRGD